MQADHAMPHADGPDKPIGEPAPLTVCITCFNNADIIERTLRSVVGLARTIVCIDSGSTDTTAAICRSFGATVIEQPFLGYVKQKQFALERAAETGEPWAMHLDSDESLEPALRAAVRDALQRDDPTIDGYELNRRVWYAGRMLNHAWQPEWRLRLVRTKPARAATDAAPAAGLRARWDGLDPHDELRLLANAAGRVARLEGVLRHDTMPTAAQFLARQISHGRITAESYRTHGRTTSPIKLATSPVGAWLRQMVRSAAWRDGWRGWVAASCAAAAALAKHTILLEHTRLAREDDPNTSNTSNTSNAPGAARDEPTERGA